MTVQGLNAVVSRSCRSVLILSQPSGFPDQAYTGVSFLPNVHNRQLGQPSVTSLHLQEEAFVTHLTVSNCVMGLYLVMLDVADQLQDVDYLWKEPTWRSSSWCAMIGFLFLLSSQVFVIVILLGTVERCWALSHPRGHVKARKVSVLLCPFCWVTGFALASTPPAWTSFRNSGACILPLVPLSKQQRIHNYNSAVLLV